ncbi:MAG TPA: 50S ribosomal protein L4 [archaeon]|nr:50S ribosomal protein L4 [archaeon]
MKVYSLDGSVEKQIDLPKVFSAPVRQDLIGRAVMAIWGNSRQPHAVDPSAGKKTAAHYIGARRAFHAMMNREMARGPRTTGSSPQQTFRERFAPQAVTGREAHPPKLQKIWSLKINDKERRLAVMSAIAATTVYDLVSKKHKIGKIELPIIASDKLEDVKKTKDVLKFLEKIKLNDEIDRVKVKKVRAGKGKMRGRRLKTKRSVLFVFGNDKGIAKSARNIPGADVCSAKDINAELLAPGTHAGRLCVFTESAVKKLGEIYG